MSEGQINSSCKEQAHDQTLKQNEVNQFSMKPQQQANELEMNGPPSHEGLGAKPSQLVLHKELFLLPNSSGKLVQLSVSLF